MQWQNGRRGVDGWGRYTRRRKWYRDAELVEVTPSTEITPSPTPIRSSDSASRVVPLDPPPEYTKALSVKSTGGDSDSASLRSGHSKSGSVGSFSRGNGIAHGTLRRRGTGQSSLTGNIDDDRPHRTKDTDWGIGDDARMGLE